MKLIGKALSNIELLFNGKAVLVRIPMSYGEELGIEIGDTSDIISLLCK